MNEKEVTREIQTDDGEFEACRLQNGSFRLRRVEREDNPAETKLPGQTHDEEYATIEEAERAAYAKYGGGPSAPGLPLGKGKQGDTHLYNG